MNHGDSVYTTCYRTMAMSQNSREYYTCFAERKYNFATFTIFSEGSMGCVMDAFKE